MALTLRHTTTMSRRGVLKIVLILAGTLILAQCRPPTPVAAAVEFAPGVGADADRLVIEELVAAFNETEAAVKKADLDAAMKFYATTYNYHGLKRSDVRRVWEEVFLHYGNLSSSHVFTELKLIQADGVRKACVTCTGGLYGTEKQTGKPITIDSWAREMHYLVKEAGAWRFLGNAGGSGRSCSGGKRFSPPSFLILDLRRLVMKRGDLRANESGKVLVPQLHRADIGPGFKHDRLVFRQELIDVHLHAIEIAERRHRSYLAIGKQIRAFGFCR